MIYLFTNKTFGTYHIFYDDDDSITGAIYAISETVTGYSFRYQNYTLIGIGDTADVLHPNEYIDFVNKYCCDYVVDISTDADVRPLIEEKIYEISIKKLQDYDI
jgi:hypothetical protein